ncbi:hypothetical protein FOA52_001385 [Chlamydomonas sp. UWO 241]|nr:hypothetical protein FOA52_001385 [Chlamydomonas sp. UWO 241]
MRRLDVKQRSEQERLPRAGPRPAPPPQTKRLGTRLPLKLSLKLAKGATITTRPPGHASYCAVSLEWLVSSFMPQHARISEQSLTTGQVMAEIVRPATTERKERYVDLMLRSDGASKGSKDARGSVSLGRSFYFASHGWARPFSEMVEMLVLHFGQYAQRVWRVGQPKLRMADVFVWIDIFAINQHPGAEQDGDLERLKEVVADCDQMVMVLDSDGKLLTRIWCLYEAWQAGRKGPGSLLLLSYGIDLDPLKQVFINLDVSKAQATVHADLERILKDIEGDVGTHAMTHALKDALVDSAVHQAPPPEDIEAADTDAEWAALEKAGAMCKLYGRYSEAEPLYRRALNTRRSRLGADHPDTMAAIRSMGQLLQAQGKLDAALALLREAYERQGLALGAEDPDTLSSMAALAGCMMDKGQLRDADPLLREGLKMRQQVLGPDDKETIDSVIALALLLKAQGKYDEAGPLFNRALHSRQARMGPDQPEVIEAVNNLASMLQAQGKLDEALPLYRRALAAREQVFGRDHPVTLTSANNLATALKEKGSTDEAELLFRRVLSSRGVLLGAEHPATLTSMSNLAWCLQAQGKNDEAYPLYTCALAVRERTLGPEHPSTIVTVNNIAGLLKAQGKLDEAEPLYRRALDARVKLLGEAHPSTTTSCNNLAFLLLAEKRLDEAEPLLRRALDARQKTLGPEHPDSVSSSVKLAGVLEEQGNLEEAVGLYRDCLQRRETKLGLKHDKVLKLCKRLGAVLLALGQTDKAKPFLKRGKRLGKPVRSVRFTKETRGGTPAPSSRALTPTPPPPPRARAPPPQPPRAHAPPPPRAPATMRVASASEPVGVRAPSPLGAVPYASSSVGVCAGLRTLEAAVPGLWRLPLLSACKEPIWRLWTTAFDPEDQKHCKGHTADLRAPAPLAPPRESCVRGNPGPVGLLAFGMTTVMLMFIETSWSDKLFLPTVIAYAAFYGGLGQFVAGLLELLKGNTFAGTAFISYGAFWMGWFMLEFLSKIDHSLPVSLTGKTLW